MKMKKLFRLIGMINSKSQAKNISVKDRIAKHQPSWMYRNE